MADGLMDFYNPFGGFQPQSLGGRQSIGFGDALAERSNSLIGLGLGLMSPYRPGENRYGEGLRGYMGGASMDATQAARRQSLAQQEAARKQAQSNWERSHQEQAEERRRQQANQDRAFSLQERQFERGDPEAGPPQTVESYDPTSGQNVLFQWDRPSRSYKRMTAGGAGGAAAADPNAPFTQGAPPVFGQGDNYGAPAAPAAAGGAQPLLPPKKPLSAHEQGTIEKADDMVAANQAVIGNLQEAKRLSRKAASGWYALERGQMGQHLPGMFGEGGKETVMLHNIVANNAVEQLKAVFGGNPTEGERKILIELQGSVNASDDVRQDVFDRAIEAANNRMEINRRKAEQVRGGRYYRPGGGVAPSASGGAAPPGAVRRYNPQTGRIE